MSDYANDFGTFCVCEQLSEEEMSRASITTFGRTPTDAEWPAQPGPGRACGLGAGTPGRCSKRPRGRMSRVVSHLLPLRQEIPQARARPLQGGGVGLRGRRKGSGDACSNRVAPNSAQEEVRRPRHCVRDGVRRMLRLYTAFLTLAQTQASGGTGSQGPLGATATPPSTRSRSRSSSPRSPPASTTCSAVSGRLWCARRTGSSGTFGRRSAPSQGS